MDTFESLGIFGHSHTQFRLAQNSTAPDVPEYNYCEIRPRVCAK